MLEVAGMSAGYGLARAVEDITLSVRQGQVLSIVGRNGVGKTTTLKAIMGLADVYSGCITIKGRSANRITPQAACRLGIGYVSQQREICPELTVEQNLLLPLLANGIARKEIDRAYVRFGRLAERRRQISGSLSGGERKLLAFARVMLLGPSIYLIDEPTEGLMPKAVDEIGELIATLVAAGACVVLVEQNLHLVRQISTNIALMNSGHIEQTVPILLPEHIDQYLGV
jgi:ABC-type branched-subunit amino acid transport system ATPase component